VSTCINSLQKKPIQLPNNTITTTLLTNNDPLEISLEELCFNLTSSRLTFLNSVKTLEDPFIKSVLPEINNEIMTLIGMCQSLKMQKKDTDDFSLSMMELWEENCRKKSFNDHNKSFVVEKFSPDIKTLIKNQSKKD
jgi:hypothetical protein